MVYKIYKSNNYIVVIDENDNYFEEHCATVLVTKNLTPDTTYTVTFFRPENTPQAFYNIPFADIRQQSGAPYASVAAWETWYTSNTGLCSNNVVLNSILATLQAQTDVEGVFVRDTGNLDKIVLQVKVWDQDSQTYIATYYYNPDGTLYTPVGPLEWVGTAGAVTADITSPLGDITACADAVAVTFCAAQSTEFFDQGNTLDDILTELTTGTIDVNITNTGLDIRTLTCTDEVSLCHNGSTVTSSNPLPVDPGALTPSADGVGTYGSTDGGTNWTAVQVDTNGIVSTNTTIVGPVGNQDCDVSIAVSLCTAQALNLEDIKTAVQPITTITPNIQISSGDAAIAITVPVYSVTFFNNGSVDVLISFSGGGIGTYVNIPAGTSITMDAGGINNQYPANTFYYDTFTADPLGSLIVTYNS